MCRLTHRLLPVVRAVIAARLFPLLGAYNYAGQALSLQNQGTVQVLSFHQAQKNLL